MFFAIATSVRWNALQCLFDVKSTTDPVSRQHFSKVNLTVNVIWMMFSPGDPAAAMEHIGCQRL